MHAKRRLFFWLACKVTQTMHWYIWLIFCLFERMTGLKKFSSTGLNSLFVIVLFQIQSLTNGYDASKLMVQGEVNKVMYGYSFLNISGMTMAKCLEYCLANCLCLSFQICGHTSECQLCTANKYSNPHAMRQFEGCTSYNFGDQPTLIHPHAVSCTHQLWAGSNFDESQREVSFVWPLMRVARESHREFQREAISKPLPRRRRTKRENIITYHRQVTDGVMTRTVSSLTSVKKRRKGNVETRKKKEIEKRLFNRWR